MKRATTVCDVCRLLDGNLQQKPCTWCGLCQSWICDADLQNWPRRGRAAAIKWRTG